MSGFSWSIFLIHSSSSGVNLETKLSQVSLSTSSLMAVNTAGQYSILWNVNLKEKKINKIKDIMNLLNLPAPLKDDLKMKAMGVN